MYFWNNDNVDNEKGLLLTFMNIHEGFQFTEIVALIQKNSTLPR